MSTRLLVTDSFDWSGTGKGKHAEFEMDEYLPLKIGRFLGRGASSDVHETTCRGIVVAVKRIQLPYRDSTAAPFQREMKSLERIGNHEHIIQIMGSFIQGRTLGFLLRPVAICDLRTLMDDYDQLRDADVDCVDRAQIVRKLGSDGLHRLAAINSFDTTCKCQSTEDCSCTYNLLPGYHRFFSAFGCLAGAITYLHGQKVKHKDLKPSNILLTVEGICITDFGQSSEFSDSNVSATDTGIRGSRRYFAPEVAEYQFVGRAADIFSLGCVYLELVCQLFDVRREDLGKLLTRKDGSYQANVTRVRLWLRSLDLEKEDRGVKAIGGKSLKGIILEMLLPDHTSRPKALHIFGRLRNAELEFLNHWETIYSLPLCGGCCRNLRVLA